LSHPIQCSCGTLKGTLSRPESVNRCVCYCRDCQAFAHFLKREADVLDELGGTDILQTLPRYVAFTKGAENLACMRLTEKGLLRWYARCCNTPIGNTLPNFKMSFVGLIHTCLRAGDGSLDNAFGPIRLRVHTGNAKGASKPKSGGFATSFLRLMGMMLRARIDGSFKTTPFFSAESGAPIVTPKVLNTEELQEIMSRV